jgi:predicted TPR repeat methyltransferase
MDISEVFELAVRRHRAGDSAEARAAYRAVLVSAPDHAESWHRLGLLVGDPVQAARLIGRAARIAPDDAFVLNNLGNALRASGRIDAAAAALADAADRLPDHAAIRANLGTALLDAGRPADACDQLAEAVRLAPDDRDFRHRLATALYRLHLTGQDWEAGQRAAAWAVARPDDPVARHTAAALGSRPAPERCSDAWVTETFDRFADSFDTALAAVEYRVPERLAELLRRHRPDPAGALRILDAGCGTGLCAPGLRPYASRLTGVDLSERMLTRAAGRQTYDALVQAELTAFLTAREQGFDLIVAADLLIYFGALEDLLTAARRALAPGGMLLCAAEQGPDPDGWTLTASGRYAHGRHYLATCLNICGFDAVEWTEDALRRENRRPVTGLLVLAVRRPGPSSSPTRHR